jgi:elongator complex protein 1
MSNWRDIAMFVLEAWVMNSGWILFPDNPEQNQFLPVTKLPEFCLQSQGVPLDPDFATTIFIGLGNSSKLHVASDQSAHILASNTTSFAIASGFVIYTTTAHEVIFAPLNALQTLLSASDSGSKDPSADWPTRRVERGSRIVVAVSSSMSLVLQMPRGNLETINPRPLVMEVVKQDLDA